ncbi:MAG: hypothetical protein IPI83_08020 [Sphingomonadales bacterium]|nr:hypothetical protein [Sphingomonadales bacterium]
MRLHLGNLILRFLEIAQSHVMQALLLADLGAKMRVRIDRSDEHGRSHGDPSQGCQQNANRNAERQNALLP